MQWYGDMKASVVRLYVSDGVLTQWNKNYSFSFGKQYICSWKTWPNMHNVFKHITLWFLLFFLLITSHKMGLTITLIFLIAYLFTLELSLSITRMHNSLLVLSISFFYLFDQQGVNSQLPGCACNDYCLLKMCYY